MNEAIVIKQDKSEDLTIDVTTTQTESGYITTISIQSENPTIIEQIKTASLELAEAQHEIVVTRLRKKADLKLPYFERTDQRIRPKVRKNNPYLDDPANFNTMLPGTVD